MDRSPWLGTVVRATCTSIVTLVGLIALQAIAAFPGDTNDSPKESDSIWVYSLDGCGQKAIAIALEDSAPHEGVQRVARVYDHGSRLKAFQALPLMERPWAAVASGGGRYAFLSTIEGGLYAVDLSARSPLVEYVGRHRGGYAKQLACTADGSILVVAGVEISGWHLATARKLWSIDRPARCVCHVPGSDNVVCGLATGDIVELDTATGQQVRRMDGNGVLVHHVAASPDGRWLATMDVLGTCKVIERDTCRIVWSQSGSCFACIPCFSNDGQSLVLPHPEPDVDLAVIDWASGTRTAALVAWTGKIVEVAMAADNSVIIRDSCGEVSIWKPTSRANPPRKFRPRERLIAANSSHETRKR